MSWMQSSIKVPTNGSSILLVIAHPDDEVMFFTPTLNLLKEKNEIHILSLSNGNFEGLGDLRASELLKSAALHSIPADNVTIIEHGSLQDSLQSIWPTEIISEIVRSKVYDLKPHYVRQYN